MAINDWTRNFIGPSPGDVFTDFNAVTSTLYPQDGTYNSEFYASATPAGRSYWQYIYNGPDSASFPTNNVIMSAAIRLENTALVTNGLTGFFLKQQAQSPTSTASFTTYFAGLNGLTVGGNTPTLAIYKIQNNVITGTSSSIPLSVSADKALFSVQMADSGANVEFFYTDNVVGGFETSMFVDTSPISGNGYAGFGQFFSTSWSGSYSGGVVFDSISIEVP